MLVALILVAGVANLNLSVANVALPSIGKHFDSSQTTLDLIAVGYSLGLAASVLYLGALGDRYGRKLMLILGMVLSIPACLLAAFAPTDGVLFARARPRRRLCGHGVSDDARVDRRAVVRPGAHEVDRAVVGSRRRHRVARAARRRRAARAFRLGIGLPDHAAARRGRTPDGLVPRSEPRQRDDRPGRQPRRRPLRRPGRHADPVDQLRAGAQQGRAGGGTRRDRCRGTDRLLRPAAPGEEPAVRPRSRGPTDVLGRCRRRDHRVRLAHGRRVREPAVPAERARLLDARGRCGVPARRSSS